MRKLNKNWFKKAKKNSVDKIEYAELPYTALSPISDANIDGDYKKALDWALNNRNKSDIKNIALTGPYGSGKSSILKTYISTYKGTDLHFLPISLATFKEEEPITLDPNKDDLLRQIELSILQQIFYREEDSKIPDSRFRKIKNYTKKELGKSTIALCIFLFSIFNLIYPEFLELLLKVKFPSWVTLVLRYISILTGLIGLFVTIYKSIRIFSGIKLSKLNIQNAEIEINEKANKSILNHHLDEIIYFFEVTEYNVVIIEDLDRFKQTEIFTKLREINLLLNSSKKINRSIVFIYAVRDDMFKDQNERTKFFDFIIPVIPIINTSNSSQKLLEKKEIVKLGISEDLLDSLSLFIDDMRLLHNISNEFYLYHQKLNKNLNQNRLLAIIVYKNVFPKDFTLLSHNKGVLYDTINSKHQYIKKQLDSLDEKLKNTINEIKEFENLKIKDIRELRLLYLPFIIAKLPGFISFQINNIDVTPDQMVSDSNFDYLISGTAYYKYYASYQRSSQISTKLNEIEKLVDSSYTYAERKRKIYDLNNDKLESLKVEIHKIEMEKVQARNLKIKNLVQRDSSLINIPEIKQRQLVTVLLRNDYINEDYIDYVSLFYEGSITKDDYLFLINVKSHIATEFSHKLQKISKLISKINEAEFDTEFVLNYTLIDEVFASARYQIIRSKILSKLKDESDISVKFIDGYLDSGNCIPAFVLHLSKAWSNIWTFLETKSNFSQERKLMYFKSIIEYTDIVDIKRLYEDENFKAYLLQRADFLNIIPNSERLMDIIKNLDIKFTNLNMNVRVAKDLLKFIHNGNYYQLNVQMVKSILSQSDKLNEAEFNTKNFYTISRSGLNRLCDYINDNINEYIKDVYLKLDDNIEDDEEALLNLLNNENLTLENRISIIKQVVTKVSDLSLINDLEINEQLIRESKVFPSWDNLFHQYEKNGNQLSQAIIVFLENEENGLQLATVKISTDIPGERKYKDFILHLITNPEFNNGAYENILQSVPYRFTTLDISKLSKNKIALQIKHSILAFNSQNYESLKVGFPDLHIQFLLNNKSKFLVAINDYDLDDVDVLMILKSQNFTLSEKNQIVDKVSEDLLSVNAESIKTLGELILTNNSFRVTKPLLKLILSNDGLTIERRIRVHNWKYDQLDFEDYSLFLTSLGEPYSEILINGKKPLLTDTEYNSKFVDILDSKNYISSFSKDEKGIRISTFRKSE